MYRIRLSPYAKIFYIEWLLDPKSYRYNIVIDQTLYGDLSIERLRIALRRYVEDNVLLNSHIQDINGEPYWIKNDNINELEYSASYPQDKAILLNYAMQSFDLYSGPLYRFKLLRIDDKTYRFILVFHHLVIDGVSVDIGLYQTLSNYYNNENHSARYSIGEQIRLNQNLTDSLYANLEQNRDEYKKFWQYSLSDVESVDLRFLKLDLGDAGVVTEGYNPIGEIKFKYTEVDLEKLSKVKRRYKITPYIYGRCILVLLLNRYTGQKRFAINYPVAINKSRDFIYGSQLNTNIIPFQFCSKTTIVDLLEQTRIFLNSLKQQNINYGDYPIANIVQDGNKHLLDVSFIQTDLGDTKFTFNGITKVEISSEFRVESVTRDSLLFEQKLKNDYRVRYDRRVIDDGFVNNFVTTYRRIILEVLDDLVNGEENKLITDYNILTVAQYHQVVDEWNKTERKYPKNKTIHELFAEQVARTPNSIAIVYKDIKLTYQELNVHVNQLANYLVSQYRIKPDELIALYLGRSEHMLIAILATLKAGGAYVPLDLNAPTDRIKYLLKDTKTRVVLTDALNASKLTAILLEIEKAGNEQILIDILIINDTAFQAKLELQAVAPPEINVTSNNLAYVIYTSGTTGGQNGVMIEHKGVVNLYSDLVTRYKLTKPEVILQFANYVFDASVEQIVLSLLSGYTLLLVPDQLWLDIRLFNTYLRENKVTHIHATPSFLELFDFSGIHTLKRIISGGDFLSSCLTNHLKDIMKNIDVINEYGPTETTVTSIVNTSGSYYIGKPIANTQAYILDNNLKPLPIGAIGELYIGGDGLARGYLNRPDLTKKRFILNPFQNTKEKSLNINNRLYKTGDLVSSLPDGNLNYIGRNDFQVKIKGFRIELGEIEKTLKDYPGIRQVVVLVKERSYRDIYDKYLVAYYCASNQLDEVAILKYLATQLPEYMIPKILVYLKQLPLTVNGKIDRRALPEPKFVDNTYEAPHNGRERLICEEFAKILGLEKVGINRDFFELGGDSLKAITLTSKLQNNFDIKVTDIFEMRTPKKIAQNIKYGKVFLKQKLKKIKSWYQEKQVQTVGSDIRLQKKANSYLLRAKNFKINPGLRKKITNVLITGATGYLGCNILNQLLLLTNYNLYLLVRAPSQREAYERINKKYQFYFGKTLDDVFRQRVFVIKSNIEKNNLDLEEQEYDDLVARIDSIIHAAALVKHYGEYDRFYSANVQATINLLEFSLKTLLKDFHYISTYSVLTFGFVPNYQEYIYTEDDMPDNLEQFYNVYNQTKLQGEKEVIRFRDYGVSSSIYRIGNLAFMAENYRTQENKEDNSFFKWLEYVLAIRGIGKDINTIELSQTDLTARGIVKLFDKVDTSNLTHHLFNHNLLNLAEVFSCCSITPIRLLIMTEFINNIINNLDSGLHYDLLVRFLLRQGWLDKINLENTTSIKVLQDRTRNILRQLDFEWLPITDKIFYSYLESTGLLERTNGKYE